MNNIAGYQKLVDEEERRRAHECAPPRPRSPSPSSRSTSLAAPGAVGAAAGAKRPSKALRQVSEVTTSIDPGFPPVAHTPGEWTGNANHLGRYTLENLHTVNCYGGGGGSGLWGGRWGGGGGWWVGGRLKRDGGERREPVVLSSPRRGDHDRVRLSR